MPITTWFPRLTGFISAFLCTLGVTSTGNAQVHTDCVSCDTYSVAVTPDGSTAPAKAINSTGFYAFTVKNTGNNTGDTFTITCSASGGVTCTGTSVASVTLAGGMSSSVKAFFTTGPTVGTGRLNLVATSAVHDDGNSGYVLIPMVSDAPLVSLAPYSPGARDLPDCIEACFSKVWMHRTSEVYRLTQPHAFTLVYQSSRARPMSFIQLDVSPGGTGVAPAHYQVEVRRTSDNTLLTLMNGATSVYYTATSGTQRLVAAFDRKQNNLTTTDVAITVSVTALFAGGAASTTTVSTNAIGVDRSQSMFGAGFWPAGVQQYYGTSAGGLVAEGEGAVFLFANGAIPGGTSTSVTASAPTWVRRTYLDGSFVEFDYNTGYPKRTVDRFGNTTTYFWTGSRLDSIGIPQNVRFVLGYDANGRLATVTDPAGRITRYTVDTQNRLTRIQDPDGRATNLAYDTNGLLVGMTPRSGAQWAVGYDALRQIAADSAPAISIYTGASKRPVVSYASDVSAAWQPNLPGTSAATAKAAVMGDTLVARVTSPMGATTKYSRDRFGAATKIVNHYGATTTITRDTMGRATSITEPNGHVTNRTYTGHLLAQTNDVTTGRIINYAYNARNDVTTITGDIARRDFIYYNGESLGPIGALKQVYLGNTAAYPTISASATLLGTQQVQADGRVSITKDNANHETLLYYSAGSTGNLSHMRDAGGNFTRWYYDIAGRLDSIKVPSAGKYTYTYGALNQKLTETNPLGQQVAYEYDPATLDLVRVVDAKGQVYKYAYNALGMLTVRRDVADTTKADSLWYDEGGNVRKMKTRRGDVITLEYDLIGRMVARTAPNMPIDSFRFANNGRWTVAVNANAYDSLAFDAAGRLTSQRELIGNAAAVWQLSYDKQDRVTTRQLAYAPSGYQSYSTYRYNSVGGMLDTVCTSSATCGVVTRDGELLPATTTYYEPGGTGSTNWVMSQGFDSLHSVQAASFTPSALNTKFGVTLARDSLDRVKVRTATGGGANPIRAFRYDQLHRLTNSCDSTSGIIQCYNEYGRSGTNAYTYDPAGNRTDPDAGGPLVISPGNRVYQFKNYTYSYDNAGNVTSKYYGIPGPGLKTTDYTWDALNRLTRVEFDHGLVASFAYDALGRRISKTTLGGAQRFVHDGARVSLDIDASGNVTNEYFTDPQGGQLLAIKNTAWLNTWYQAVAVTDPDLGTVRGLAAFTGGRMIKQYPESSWGSAADTGVTVRFRMGGQEFDAETGLYYMRARYYDPSLGRFISEDPTGIISGLNQYSYANNDPINWRDPSGLGPVKKNDPQDPYTLPEVTFTIPQIGGIGPPSHLPSPGRCTSLPAIGPGRGMGTGGGGRMQTPVRDLVATYVNNLGNLECAQATLIAAVSFAGDVTFVGAGVKAVGLGVKGAMFLNQAVRAAGKAPGELVVASVKRFDAARFYGGVAATGYTMGGTGLGLQHTYPLAGAGGFNPLDLLPFIGTARSFGAALDACLQ